MNRVIFSNGHLLTAADVNLFTQEGTPATLSELTVEGNVTLGDASTDTLNVGNGGLIKDSAGNVGIGATPRAWDASFKALQIRGSGIMVGSTGSTYQLANAYFDGAYKYSASSFAVKYEMVAGSHAWFTAPSGTAGDPISFTQAMTLNAGGSLNVGQTSSGYANANGLSIQPISPGAYIVYNHASGSPSGSLYATFGYAGGGIGSITQSGTTAVAYNTTSDHRLKENVRDADAARFMDLKFRDFEWIDGRHDCGVIAHELQQVYPDLVLGEKDATEIRTVEITPAIPAVFDEDGSEVTPAVPAVTEEQPFPVYQQVNYIGLIGRMGTRVQALQRTIDAQAALIEAMEARLSALETQG